MAEPSSSSQHQQTANKNKTMEDAWAEAFALAEGNDVVALPSSQKNQGKARNPSSLASQTVDPRVSAYLPPITEDQELYYELHGLLCPDSSRNLCCKKYTRSNDRNEDQCESCGRPSGYHQLATKNSRHWSTTSPSEQYDENPFPASQLYVAVRNLRCCLRINPGEVPPPEVTKAFQEQVHKILANENVPVSKKPFSKKKRKRRRYACDTSFAVDSKLLDACRAVTEGQSFPGSASEDTTPRKDRVSRSIKWIMACDAIYYRLYYSGLTSEGSIIVPHPVQYFGCCDEDISSVDGGKSEASQRQDDSSVDSKRRAELQLIFGLGSQIKTTHALERLHQLRMNEGRFLSGQLESTLDDSLWHDWQDSCRDFLCHLYSYATVSSTCLQQLRERLVGHSVVEVGAGTGYLAHLVGGVDALDCHPGTADNEYHAATPPFMNVKTGGPKSIGEHHSTLMLCYPPVDNEMAYESLQTFLSRRSHSQRGQRPLFVHVGEFQGLTGTPRFESLLLEKLYCIDRWPCLSWGSDAAEVTMWELRSPREAVLQPMSLLVPCARCNRRPSTRRFRNARPFCYCDLECAQEDMIVRQDVLLSRFSIGLSDGPSQTDSRWQNLRVAPRLSFHHS